MHKFLLFFLFLGLQISIAQEPVSIHLNEKDGLPDNEIYSILEDHSGYIWLAGNKGLFRYNGKTFDVFSHTKKRGRSFFNLKLDSKGRVWCNNIAGQFFYVENDSLNLFGNFQHLLKGNLSDYTFFNNKLVIKVANKEQKKNHITFIDLETKLETLTNNQAVGTGVGITIDGLFYFINQNNELATISSNNEIRIKGTFSNSPKGFTNFFKVGNGFFVILSDKSRINTQLYAFNNGLKKIKLPNKLLNVRIEHINYSQSQFYLSTNNGTYIVNYKDDSLIIKEHFLKEKFTTKTLKDTNKNLWVSSLNNGVYVIPNETLKTIPVSSSISVLHKINDSIAFAGLKNGQVLKRNTTNNTTTLLADIKGSEIRAITSNTETNNVLIVSDKTTLRYNLATKTILSTPVSAGVKSTNYISNDTFLISTSYGTYIFNTESKLPLTTSRSYISLYSKLKNRIYISDVDGLKLFDTNGHFIKEIKFNNHSIYAFDIKESNDGTLWLATYDKGVLALKNDTVILELNTEKGLASNTINTLQTDGNNVWIATEGGLQFYNTNNKTINTITKQDGLDSYTIKTLAVLKNTVFFASNLGLFSFNKQNIFKKRNIATPYITHVSIEEKDTLVTSNYQLKQTESSMQFRFNTKGFWSNKSIKYQYQLKGKNKSWIDIQEGSDYVKFTSLPAGNFTFNLRAKHKFANIYANADPITLSIRLPFYKRWWFWSLIFLCSISLVFIYFKTQTKRLKKQQKIELEKAQISKDLVFSKLENLRSQMNPHFIFNALNSIQDYIITNEKKMARQYLVKFSRLIRMYLEHSQKNEVSLAEELAALQLYLQLEKDRFEGNFEYEIIVDPLLNEDTITIPSLLIQPYVENALKHGLLHIEANKNLSVAFKKVPNVQTMVCEITDNGIGRKASAIINAKRNKNHNSFATSANQKRIDLLNMSRHNKLSVNIIDLYNNSHASGTKIILSLPL